MNLNLVSFCILYLVSFVTYLVSFLANLFKFFILLTIYFFPFSVMKRFSRFSHLSVNLSTLLSGIVIGATMTTASAGLLGSSVFPDSPSGSYYDTAVGEMNSLGIIKGYDDGRFGPNDFVTRAQVAVMMQRLRNEIKGIVTTASSSSARSRRSSSSSSSSSSSDSSSSFSVSSIPSQGIVRLTTYTYTANENAGKATITIIRTGGNRGEVTIKYTLTADTATAGDDFDLTNGTAKFNKGETSASFDIILNDDSDVEGDEKVHIVISEPAGGAILDTTVNEAD